MRKKPPRWLPVVRQLADCLLPIACCLLPIALAESGAAVEYPLVLSYHQVIPDDRPLERGMPVMHISDFDAQLRWLAEHGIRTLTLVEYIEAISQPDPPRDAVLLTADDGYESVYTLMRPLLEQYGMHMVAFVITGRVGKRNTINPNQPWLTWQECRELEESGVVEIESHSHAGHDPVDGLRLGRVKPGPFFTTRIYDPATGVLETEEQYRERIRTDLARAREEIEMHLGRPPLALAWPLGESNDAAEFIAQEVGYSVTFSLDKRPAAGSRGRLAIPEAWAEVVKELRTTGEGRGTRSGGSGRLGVGERSVGEQLAAPVSPAGGASSAPTGPSPMPELGLSATVGALLVALVLSAVVFFLVVRLKSRPNAVKPAGDRHP